MPGSAVPSPSSPTEPAPTAATTPEPNPAFSEVASEEAIAETARALEAHGMRVLVVPDGDAARRAVLDLLPAGSEVLDVTSQTLAATGIARAIAESGRYRPVRPELVRLHQEGKHAEARRLGASPEFAVGSVHAVTRAGDVVIASATGSQVAPYAAGAGRVIWVVGAQKIVPTLEEAFRRIREYAYPLEDRRAHAAYGVGSRIAKLLIVSAEHQPGRLTVILVRQNLGF